MKPIGNNDAPQEAPTAGRTTIAAIAAAYRAYRAELRRFLSRRSRNAQDGEDLVQEVYLQLLRFPPREPLQETQAYLYRVAWHVVNRANEKSQRDYVPYAPETLEQLAQQSGITAPDDLQRQLELQQQLVHLLSELPMVCQEVVLKFKCEGFSYQEIAGQLGISVHMVEKHIARAVQHLRLANWE